MGTIGSSGKAWFPQIEGEVFRRMRELTLTASTQDGAVWLAKLHGCLRRGRLDAAALRSLADDFDAHHAFQAEDNCGGN
jgi:hypothetical protein